MRKRNKIDPIGKEEIKWLLFVDDMNLCRENPKKATKKTCQN
jgi:hypothetical protein